MKNQKKVMVWITAPLLFLLIGYVILYAIAQPYLRPMISLYNMISQDQAQDFSSAARNLYEDSNGLPTDGEIRAEDIPTVRIGDTMGKVIVSNASVNVPLIYGSNEECLYGGAGLRKQSHMPGYGKPVMIAGHTIPYFKNLGLVEIGDIITIETYYGIFKYEITGTGVANAFDTSAYNLKQDKEQLILFTCYPLDGIGEKDDRLFVYADKVSGPRVVGDEE